MSSPISPTTIDDLSYAMSWCNKDEEGQPRRGALFWIGAGCSVSAGIPTAYEIAKQLTLQVSNVLLKTPMPVSTEGWSDDEYEARFKVLQEHYERLKSLRLCDAYSALCELIPLPEVQRDMLRPFVAPSARGRINWAHVCLGELVREGYVHSILSTNFDLLALRGLMLAGVVPVVCDGFESLNRIQSKKKLVAPQIFHVHGSLHSYNLRNTRNELNDVSSNQDAYGTLRQLFSDSDVVVIIGYRGSDDEGLMRALMRIAHTRSNVRFYWVSYTMTYDELSEPVRKFLEEDPLARRWLGGWDADDFFLKLMKRLGLGAPRWVSHPVEQMLEQVESLSVDTASQLIQQRVQMATQRLQALLDRDEEEDDKDGWLLDLELKGPKAVWDALCERPLADRGHVHVLELKARMKAAFELADRYGALSYLARGVADADDLLKTGYGEPDFRSEVFLEKSRALSKAAELQTGKDALANLNTAISTAQKGLDLERSSAEMSGRRTIKPDVMNRILSNRPRLKQVIATATVTRSKRNSDIDELNQACEALRQLYRELDRTTLPVEWSRVAINYGNALRSKTDLTGEPEALYEAIDVYAEVKSVITAATRPEEWAALHNNFGNARRHQFDIEKRSELLDEAYDLCNEALRLRDGVKESHPRRWLYAKINVAETSLEMAIHANDKERLLASIQHYRECRAESHLSDMPALENVCDAGLFTGMIRYQGLGVILDESALSDCHLLAAKFRKMEFDELAGNRRGPAVRENRRVAEAHKLALEWSECDPG